MKMRPPQKFSLAALSFTAGTFMASTSLASLDAQSYLLSKCELLQKIILSNSCSIYVIGLSIGLFLALYFSQSPQEALLISALPIVAFTHAALRLPIPTTSDIYHLKKERLCIAQVEIISPYKENKFIARAIALTFPFCQKLSGFTLLSCKTSLNRGDILSVKGKVNSIKATRNPAQFDYRTFLARKNIFSTLKAKEYEITGKHISYKSKIESIISQLRKSISKEHVRYLGKSRGLLLSSIILGDRAVKLPNDVRENFRTVGLSHLLAASGFNLSILVASIYFLCKQINIRRELFVALCLSAIACFVALAGFSPSVSRAALVLVFLVLSKFINRRANSIAILSFSLIIFCLIDPTAILDVGLQLSYAATYSIILGMQLISPVLKGLELGRFSIWLIELASVIMLAQAAVLPIQLYYFFEIGLFFLIANLIVDPIVAPITVIGFISSITIIFQSSIFELSWTLGEFAKRLDWLVSIPLSYMLEVANQLTQLSNSILVIGRPSIEAILAYYLCFLILVTQKLEKKRLVICTFLFLISIALLFQNMEVKSNWIIVSKTNLYLSINGKLYSNRTLSRSSIRLLKFSGIKPCTLRPLQGLKYKCYSELNLYKTPGYIFIAGSKNGKFSPLNLTPYLKLEAKEIQRVSNAKKLILWTKKPAPGCYILEANKSPQFLGLDGSKSSMKIYP